MNDIFLFCCGIGVTLITGFGVIVYAMTPPSYQKIKIKLPEPDIDLGAAKSVLTEI